MIRHFWNQKDFYFLSSEDKVVKVETLQVLYFASTNYSLLVSSLIMNVLVQCFWTVS